jgi:hypothetical protein
MTLEHPNDKLLPGMGLQGFTQHSLRPEPNSHLLPSAEAAKQAWEMRGSFGDHQALRHGRKSFGSGTGTVASQAYNRNRYRTPDSYPIPICISVRLLLQ